MQHNNPKFNNLRTWCMATRRNGKQGWKDMCQRCRRQKYRENKWDRKL